MEVKFQTGTVCRRSEIAFIDSLVQRVSGKERTCLSTKINAVLRVDAGYNTSTAVLRAEGDEKGTQCLGV
jgi:hypothetical protein